MNKERVYPSKAAPAMKPPPPMSRKSNAPIPARHRRQRSGVCRRCCVCVCVAVAVVVVLAGAAAVAFWLLVRPRSPVFRLESLQLKRLSVSSTTMDYDLRFGIDARNPNRKIAFDYADFAVTAALDHVQLPQQSVPGFRQPHQNETHVAVQVKGKGFEFSGNKAEAKRLSAGHVSLHVHLRSSVRVKIGGYRSGRLRIDVSCSAASVAVPPKQNAAADSDADCDVKFRFKILRWYLG